MTFFEAMLAVVVFLTSPVVVMPILILLTVATVGTAIPLTIGETDVDHRSVRIAIHVGAWVLPFILASLVVYITTNNIGPMSWAWGAY